MMVLETTLEITRPGGVGLQPKDVCNVVDILSDVAALQVSDTQVIENTEVRKEGGVGRRQEGSVFN